MNDSLLPLGSIVLLEGGAQKLLIIARGLNVINAGRTFFFDYGAVPYPDGVQGDRMAYFQRESISKIVFEGYRDVDDENLTEAIERYIRENPDLLRGDPKTWPVSEQA